ncbi:MAG: SAM-dependent methyltransferase [Clostridia bacterium]|nr:SAM-dependent methyltransferase [Clostridia bacterium]
MLLSKRLSLIASFVPAGSSVCDVGTDHGHLPVILYKSGKCKSICATDIRKKPLENARKNIEAAGIVGIDLYLADGLDGIAREQADTVIITGIGGEVISGIIDRAPILRDYNVTLILQATTSVGRLRDYLASNGFVVVSERAVEDNGKLYSVMKAHFCGIPYPIDSLRRAIGLVLPDYKEGRAYIEKQYSVIKKRADELALTGKNAALYRDSLSTAEKIEKILSEEAHNGV